MGIKLAKAALAFASERGLGHVETRLLVYMSLRALDGPAPVFWAGRDAMAAAIGAHPEEIQAEYNAKPNRKRDLPLKGSLEAGTGADDLAFARVQAALRGLIEAGAITRVSEGNRRERSRYSLIHEGKVSDHPFIWKGMDSAQPISEEGVDSTHERGGLEPRKGWIESTPEEEEEEREEENARATVIPMPFTLTAPPTPNWNDGLPEPRNAQEAARCRRHPTGTSDACGACGENRQTWVNAHRTPTKKRPEPLRHRIEQGRRICANHDHIPTVDGTCRNCEIRADDLAHLIGARA